PELRSLQFFYRLIQYFLIRLEADVDHETTLLTTQHIPRSPDIEITHGDLETAAEITVLLQCLQPFARVGRQRSQRWRQQITKSFLVPTPHPAPQLMQITQSEMVRVIHDDRIDVGDVYTTLHDIRTDQYVIFPVDKAEDAILQVMAFHLP